MDVRLGSSAILVRPFPSLDFPTLPELVDDILAATDDGLRTEDDDHDIQKSIDDNIGEVKELKSAQLPPLARRGDGRTPSRQRRRLLLTGGAVGGLSAALGTRPRCLKGGRVCCFPHATGVRVCPPCPQERHARMVQENDEEAGHGEAEDQVDGLVVRRRGRRGGHLGEDGGHDDEGRERHGDAVAGTTTSGDRKRALATT